MISEHLHSSAQYGLALHTTTQDLGLALSNFSKDHRSQTWNLGRALSTHLHSHLSEFIQPQTWKDLAFIAVARGPGSFTSTRIGVVTARTLAQQLEIPLFAPSTLAVMAWSQRSHLHSSSGVLPDIAVQMPAQRGEVFVGIYKAAESPVLATLMSDTVMTVEAWLQKLKGWSTPYYLVQADSNLGASVTDLLDLAYQDWQHGLRPQWSEALPFYGQHPVAS